MKAITKKQHDSLIKYGYVKKNGKVSAKVESMLYRINEKNTMYHFFYWSKSGGLFRLCGSSDYEILRGLLTIFGYKYEEGNDAPKGGKEGDYIKTSKAAIRGIISWINANK